MDTRPAHDAMECKQIFELLSEYLDEHLSPEECERVRRHIDGCGPCVDFLESLRRTVGLCRDCEAEVKPQPLNDEARRKLEAIYRRAIHRS